MLLGQAIELLRQDIESLSWVDRFGGLTQVVSYETFDKDNNRVVKTIPISCASNTEECNNKDQFYQNLIPDSSKKSVLYFEPLQGFTDNGAINGNQYFRNYTGRTRLVGWVNSKLLGLQDDCLLSAKLIRSLFPIIVSEFSNLTGVFEGAKIRFRNPKVVVKSPSIFSSYTYDVDTQFLINPYDYFAIDIDVVLDLNVGCEYEVELAGKSCWLGDVIGGNVPATYLGDSTGIFLGVQKYPDVSCGVVGSDKITFLVKATDRNNVTTTLGLFTGNPGDTINDASKWDSNLWQYVGENIVGDGENFTFDKLLWAQNNSSTNASSKEIFIEIRRGQSLATPVESDQILYIFREDILGSYNSPVQIAINKGTGDFYLAEFASNTGISQNFVDRFYTTRKVTDQQGLNNVTRIKLDTTEDSEGIIYFYRNQLLHRLESTGRDADNFVNFDTAQVIDSLPQTALFIPFGLLNETVNGRPVIMALVPGGVGNAAQILEWNGTSYDRTFLPNSGVFAGLATPITGDIFAYGNDVYVYYRGSSTGILRKLSYTGDYKNPANWTGVNMCTSIATPASAGTGDVASTLGGNSLYVDGAKLDAFGNPRVLLTLRPSQVIQVWQTLKANPTIPADFIASLPVGQLGSPGNVDAAGNDALLTNPIGIDKFGTDYYICGDVGDNTVKTIADNDYLVTTIKGTFGVAGRSEHIEF